MNGQNISNFNHSNNETMINDIINKLQNIVDNSNDELDIKSIITQIKNIILNLRQILKENKINAEKMTPDDNYNEYKDENFNNINIKMFNDGKYVGEFKNGLRDGKGVFY